MAALASLELRFDEASNTASILPGSVIFGPGRLVVLEMLRLSGMTLVNPQLLSVMAGEPGTRFDERGNPLQEHMDIELATRGPIRANILGAWMNGRREVMRFFLQSCETSYSLSEPCPITYGAAASGVRCVTLSQLCAEWRARLAGESVTGPSPTITVPSRRPRGAPSRPGVPFVAPTSATASSSVSEPLLEPRPREERIITLR